MFNEHYLLDLSLLVRTTASQIISAVACDVKKVGQHWSTCYWVRVFL